MSSVNLDATTKRKLTEESDASKRQRTDAGTTALVVSAASAAISTTQEVAPSLKVLSDRALFLHINSFLTGPIAIEDYEKSSDPFVSQLKKIYLFSPYSSRGIRPFGVYSFNEEWVSRAVPLPPGINALALSCKATHHHLKPSGNPNARVLRNILNEVLKTSKIRLALFDCFYNHKDEELVEIISPFIEMGNVEVIRQGMMLLKLMYPKFLSNECYALLLKPLQLVRENSAKNKEYFEIAEIIYQHVREEGVFESLVERNYSNHYSIFEQLSSWEGPVNGFLWLLNKYVAEKGESKEKLRNLLLRDIDEGRSFLTVASWKGHKEIIVKTHQLEPEIFNALIQNSSGFELGNLSIYRASVNFEGRDSCLAYLCEQGLKLKCDPDISKGLFKRKCFQLIHFFAKTSPQSLDFSATLSHALLPGGAKNEIDAINKELNFNNGKFRDKVVTQMEVANIILHIAASVKEADQKEFFERCQAFVEATKKLGLKEGTAKEWEWDFADLLPVYGNYERIPPFYFKLGDLLIEMVMAPLMREEVISGAFHTLLSLPCSISQLEKYAGLLLSRANTNLPLALALSLHDAKDNSIFLKLIQHGAYALATKLMQGKLIEKSFSNMTLCMLFLATKPEDLYKKIIEALQNAAKKPSLMEALVLFTRFPRYEKLLPLQSQFFEQLIAVGCSPDKMYRERADWGELQPIKQLVANSDDENDVEEQIVTPEDAVMPLEQLLDFYGYNSCSLDDNLFRNNPIVHRMLSILIDKTTYEGRIMVVLHELDHIVESLDDLWTDLNKSNSPFKKYWSPSALEKLKKLVEKNNKK